MQRLLLVSGMVLALSACSDKTAPASEKVATPTPATAAPAAPPELITRDALFGNPERANVSISPDGRYLSWVAPVDAPDQARAINKDTARGIRNYLWTYQANTLLSLRDNGGDEDSACFQSIWLMAAARISLRSTRPMPRYIGSAHSTSNRSWSA